MQRCPSAFIIITVPRFVKIGIYKKQMFDKPQCLLYNGQAEPENGRGRKKALLHKRRLAHLLLGKIQ